jgi:hypothetical protein
MSLLDPKCQGNDIGIGVILRRRLVGIGLDDDRLARDDQSAAGFSDGRLRRGLLPLGLLAGDSGSDKAEAQRRKGSASKIGGKDQEI